MWGTLHLHTNKVNPALFSGRSPIRVVQGPLSFSIAELGIAVEPPAPAPFKFCPPSPPAQPALPIAKTAVSAGITSFASSALSAPQIMEAKPAISAMSAVPAPAAPAVSDGLWESFSVTYKCGAEELVATPPAIELLVDDAECMWLHFRTNNGDKSHHIEARNQQAAVIPHCSSN